MADGTADSAATVDNTAATAARAAELKEQIAALSQKVDAQAPAPTGATPVAPAAGDQPATASIVHDREEVRAHLNSLELAASTRLHERGRAGKLVGDRAPGWATSSAHRHLQELDPAITKEQADAVHGVGRRGKLAGAALVAGGVVGGVLLTAALSPFVGIPAGVAAMAYGWHKFRQAGNNQMRALGSLTNNPQLRRAINGPPVTERGANMWQAARGRPGLGPPGAPRSSGPSMA